VTSTTRVAALADVPTIAEFVPGYEAAGWVGIGAPAKTPHAIIDRLNTEVNAAVAEAAFKQRLFDLGMEPFLGSQAEYSNFVADFTEKWAKIILAADIKPE
jgi:tripartite-type tricarboxylate transporter receptor subunit TctC